MNEPNEGRVTDVGAGLAERIVLAVAAGFQDQVAFLHDLVRLPSQMREEERAQTYYAAALERRGYTVDRWTIDVEEISSHPSFSPVDSSYENSVNVVGVHRPRSADAGRSLILNGHIDVVPVGMAERWATDPYGATVVDGWLYGRGSADMKAGLAANLFALDALRSLGLQPASPVFVQSVVEEECTGNGALACLVRGYRADAAIITEPTHASVFNAGMGVIWFRVRMLGRPALAARPEAGVNAIFAAYRMMEALKGLEDHWNATKPADSPFAHLDRAVKLNIGRIEGGDWPSSVPDRCTFDCRISLFPGVEVADAKRDIETFVAAALDADPGLDGCEASVEYFGHTSAGYELPPNTLAEAHLKEAHRRISHKDAVNWQYPGYLDASVFNLYGDTPALVYGPIGENIHGYDERVNLESLRMVTAVLALFIADWCGVEPLS
ncbi:MAG: ArgE/DapE family deacylase [Alphaproteobacteria bacterium]|nr:ArgE/DapE family deacylase [Alphaproteobacteria bacterium]MBU1515639.1 ArgE/DapE family deacylase [Alphaproteobacteria bacterium]MBU2094898.1 ArgE/DapE family deacylase [Alphaproteobacteria bacterium]MBU2150930.1 ArgE/DapE family deacylase [Alphaproteobacteria bacterium]MBU2305907.1 ArgE/DapE family deacylase [Alphaproteobacteria bacterium]